MARDRPGDDRGWVARVLGGMGGAGSMTTPRVQTQTDGRADRGLSPARAACLLLLLAAVVLGYFAGDASFGLITFGGSRELCHAATFYMNGVWATGAGKSFTTALSQHCARVHVESFATFSIFKLGSRSTRTANLKHLARLPSRTRSRPYVVLAYGFDLTHCFAACRGQRIGQRNLCNRTALEQWIAQYGDAQRLLDWETCDVAFEVIARPDILFVMHDRRGYVLTNDTAPPLPGVTIPSRVCDNSGSTSSCDTVDVRHPPSGLRGATQFLLTFRGTTSVGHYETSRVRFALQDAYAEYASRGRQQSGASDDGPVAFDVVHEGSNANAASKESYAEQLRNSRFVLVPRGDVRWSHRFTEVIAAGAIPVVLSDGLTLPFAKSIHWPEAAVVLPEAIVENGGIPAILSALPTGEAALRMELEVQRIFRKYFNSAHVQVNALLNELLALSRAASEPGAQQLRHPLAPGARITTAVR